MTRVIPEPQEKISQKYTLNNNSSDKLPSGSDINNEESKFSKPKVSISEQLERLPISLKLILIVIFTFLSLVVFACILISNSVVELQSSMLISNISVMTNLLNNLIHCSQSERGASQLYLGANGTQHYEIMMEKRSDTNVALEEFLSKRRQILNTLQTNSLAFSQILSALQVVDEYIADLPYWRERILKLHLAQQPILAFNFFTDWNSYMIDSIMLIAGLSSDSTFFTIQSSFNTLTSMKEFTGQKRALGSAALTSHAMPAENFKLFVQNQAKISQYQHYLQVKDVAFIWDTFTKTVLRSQSYSVSLEIEDYLVSNYGSQNLTKYSGSVWFGNMTLHINNMRQVELYISKISQQYSSQLYQRSIGVMLAYIVSSVIAIGLSVFTSIIFARSIASPYQKIVELQNLQELYKSFIPAHVLLQIEGREAHAEEGNTPEPTEMRESVRNSKQIRKSADSLSSYHFLNSRKISSNHGKFDLASKFSLYLEKKKISMVQVRIQGLSSMMNDSQPSDIVNLLQDIFEKIQQSTRSTSSLMEHTEDECITIAFNASKEQLHHEDRSLKMCLDLRKKLTEIQSTKWTTNIQQSPCLARAATTIVFRFAALSRMSFCGNIGTTEVRSFKIMGSIHDHLTRMTDYGSQMQVGVVCDESVYKNALRLFHTRFIGYVECLEDDQSTVSHEIYEIGASLQVNQDEWLYELSQKQKNERWQEYNAAAQHYVSNNFELALMAFQEYATKYPEDLPTKYMLELCNLCLSRNEQLNNREL
ncbi:hypothetical protein C9374_005595 [Naegleria lovaniensis]|uniref:Nitrate/nitrite sensing protein domain-containing protein n=1 Tax=Naegleria lovaniensis TaxID=51637 RepID=A0AA88GQN1_NAELO|nr:uncharacterized protein C9374_005595 [Naegleria lovaniensis]KAG2382393.1 hypothetical protein C9374_005595 [Naegleria lovaniensis]